MHQFQKLHYISQCDIVFLFMFFVFHRSLESPAATYGISVCPYNCTRYVEILQLKQYIHDKLNSANWTNKGDNTEELNAPKSPYEKEPLQATRQ